MELQLGRKYYKVFCILAWIYLMHPSFGSIIKDSVKCTEGSVAADTDDCASYFQCIDDETVHLNCANGSYFEANNEICVVDEFGVCPTSRRLCFDGDIFGDENDCISYVKCIHGDLVKQKCPAGSYFNVISKNCRLSRTGFCASQKEICLEGELQVDSEDCAGYMECLNGDLVKKKCPIGSYFEPIFKLCQVDENGVCSSSSNECTDEEVQVDPTNCAGYFNCENGKLETKTCPSGTYFEPTYKTCIVDLKGVCVEPPAKCTEGDLVIDPNNCAGYLKCIDEEFVEEKCPAGTYYDSKLETCTVDTEGVCVTIRKLCAEGLREKDPKDCAAYTQCIRGAVEILRCDSGRYFNATQAECLIDVDEVCVKSTVEYDKDLVQFRNSESTSGDLQETTNRDSTVADFSTGSSIADFKGYSDSNPYTESTTSDVPLSTEISTPTHLDLQFTTLDRERFIDLYKVYLKSGDENVGNEEYNHYNESTTTNSDQKTESTDADFQSTDSSLLELTSQNACIFDLNGDCVDQSTRCTEGKKQRDINNCAGYLKCIEGVFVKEECPDRTYYDYNSDECLIDVDKVCVKSRVEYEKDLLKLQYSVSTSGDLQESTSTDSTVADFSTDSSIADFKGYSDSNPYTESTSYVPLSTERYTSDWQTADLDLQFTTLDRECLTHLYKICLKSGDEYYSNEGHHQYESTTTDSVQKTESTDADFQSTSQISCIFDLNGDCVNQSISCTEGNKRRDIHNCAGYLKCIEGVFVKEECPDRTYYDYNLDECLIDVDKVCVKSRVAYKKYFLKFQYSESTSGDLQESTNRDSTVADFSTGSSIADFKGYSDSNLYTRTESTTSDVPVSTESSTSDWQATDLDLQFTTLDRECLTHLYKMCLKSGDENYSNEEHHLYESTTTNSVEKTESTDADFQSTDSSLLELTSQNACIFDLNGDCVDQSTRCTEGKKQRDINNCAGYLKCIEGVFVKEECPDRTYYDYNLDECLIDVDKVCVKSRVEYEKDLLKLQYSESTSGDLQESTNTDSTVADFSTDSSIADFNRYTDPYTASTKTDVPLSTESSTSGSQTTRADLQFTTLDRDFNLENSTVTCVYNNTLVIEGIREVDPQDCAGYIECFGGEAKKLKCDSGRYFNVTQRECSIDVDEVCLKLDMTTTESTPNFTTTIDPYAKCSDGQRKLDPNNCAGFLKCVDGELHEETCPSGFFYNSTSKNCLVDIRATCVTNIKFCIEGVREEDPNNCAGYRQCISGVVQNLRCPFGQYFNVAERDCLNDVHQACARTEVDPNPDKVLHNDTGPPLTIPDESCILDINGACVDPLAKCTEGQVKLDPNNCAGYLKCKNGELIEELCPSGFYYDLQLMVCLVDRRGICVTNIQVCDEGAIEEDPYDCAGYRQCIGGQVAKLKCPFGSYFNLFVRDCLIDVDEICVRKEYNYVE